MTAAKDRLYATCLRWLVQQQAGFPAPEAARYDQPRIVLERVLAVLARGPACINTAPSAAVKLSLAAQERGAELSGLTFLLGAEPLTPARKSAIEASGARATPLYGSTEAAWIGGQCRRPEHPDEVHVLLDSYAVTTDPNSDNGSRPLRITSLQPLAPKILINAEIGDRAVIGQRRCDCLYDRLGCTTTLHTIRSSDKITEYGVNIDISDVIQILEQTFPRQFGGMGGDYQLVEAPDSKGLPRYTLFIDPRVTLPNKETAVAAFLSELSRLRPYYGYMAAILRKERVVAVQRAAPLRTRQGKMLSFWRQPPSGPSR
jgi:hypothetical protein